MKMRDTTKETIACPYCGRPAEISEDVISCVQGHETSIHDPRPSYRIKDFFLLPVVCVLMVVSFILFLAIKFLALVEEWSTGVKGK